MNHLLEITAKSRRLAPIVAFFMFVMAACSTSPNPPSPTPTEQEPTPTEQEDADASDVADEQDAAVDDAGPTCATASCQVGSDCVAPLNGKAGCWKCEANCCVPVTAGLDPNGACTSYACRTSTCDGRGSCGALKNVAKGTSCGAVCYHSGGTVEWLSVSAVCDGKGTCKNDPDDFSSMECTGSVTACKGHVDGCASCPPGGCQGACAPSGAAAPSCP